MRNRSSPCLHVAVLLALAAPFFGFLSAAAAVPEPPDGIGAVKLGMSLDEARAFVPSLPASGDSPSEGKPSGFAYAEEKLPDQQFGELRPCEATLRFFQKRLIGFKCTCADKSATQAYLLKQYGTPGVQKPESWEWRGEARSMAYDPQSGAISVMDNKGNLGIVSGLRALVRAAQPPGATAPAAVPPAAVPPAPSK